jgi:porin
MRLRLIRWIEACALLAVIPPNSYIAHGADNTKPGVRSHLTAVIEVWQNAEGGIRRGNWQNALVDVTTTVEGPLIGAPSGSQLLGQVQAVGNSRAGSFADDTGAFNPVSGIMANNHIRVFNLHYSQSASDNRWALKLGQLVVDDDFMVSPYAGMFANAAFGSLPSQVATPLCSECARRNAFPVYSVAAPGLWFRFGSVERSASQIGIYYGAPGTDTDTNRGFSWGNSHQSGALIFSERLWHYAIGRLDATSRLGLSAHSGRVDDFAAERARQGAAHVRGLYSLYAVHDLVLAADSAGQPLLAAFARAGFVPERGRTVVDAYGDCGFNWFSPFGRRGEDALGVAVSITHFGSDFRASAGYPRTQCTLEATYKARLTPRLVVQPDVQWLFNSGPHTLSHRRDTALILGVRATVTL